VTINQLTKQTTNVDIEIGFRIRKVRQSKHLSQTKVALLLGITYQQLQKYELGKNKVSASRLSQIAQILNVSEQELLNPIINSIQHKPEIDNDNISDLWLRIMNKNHRVLILKMMETFAGFES
jgi:transcriptional regulator with XRE-family HTH domain